ncbi:hypothetical protein E2C01_069250 [Portunus trituberculatus]|uniref:Uncharacterized protein n=1 Tax=Portunus trituberculatus TaxID=210409 RepID=A0A5B7HU16_PORTR|nr:hypothetical protein [Portunus trituberculatus]
MFTAITLKSASLLNTAANQAQIRRCFVIVRPLTCSSAGGCSRRWEW